MKLNTYTVSIVFFLYFSNIVVGQCWETAQVPNGYMENTSYSLDSLIVSKKLIEVLDHSVALVDSLEVDLNDTWLYYVICINSAYSSQSGIQFKIELQQGVDYNIFNYRLFEEGDAFSGGFCYKGYTFFVLSNMESIYNKFFQTKNKKDFHIYYKRPVVSNEWQDLGYPNMIKFIYLFYQYKDGNFVYSSTSFSE
jgi:hypothetical protein